MSLPEGHGWDLTVAPKKAPAKAPEKRADSVDGTELQITPKRPRDAPAPEKAAKGKGAEGKADSDPARQRPGALEEDAEIWVDPKKGGKGWVTPAGDVASAAPPVGEGGDGPQVEEDEDTEIIVTPRKPDAAPQGRARPPGSKEGKEGTDFQEYQRPVAPPVSPVLPASAAPAPRPNPLAPAPAPAQPPRPPVTPPGQRTNPTLRKGGPLRVLVVGSGAREHAMSLALLRTHRAQIFAATRHRNPGIVKAASGFRILEETDVEGVTAWAKAQKIDLAVIGPESALAAGLTDALRDQAIAVASPTRQAAQVEVSKTFLRDLMARHGIGGQVRSQAFQEEEPALAWLDKNGPVCVVKPVGLTGGKGVQVYGDHFTDLEGAKAYVRALFASGAAVQFEELLRGEEFSLMVFTDGVAVVPMPAVQDHKRLREGDQGPNTGGMGSYSQADGLLPFLSRAEYDAALGIVNAIVRALAKEGTPYCGVLYGQFMLTSSGPRVIEVNARFGDPEALNVLHTLETDYLSILEAMVEGRLAALPVAFRPRATVVKYVVPQGYGESVPAPGRHIEVDEFNVRRAGGTIYYAGIEQQPMGPFATLSSRTLAVLGEGETVAAAEAVVSRALPHIHGEGLVVRHDIGTAPLLARRVQHMAEIRGVVTQAR
ncbi:MAG: phosphoribosylamine--glycine ligase [Thermoplasmatota archaeon]